MIEEIIENARKIGVDGVVEIGMDTNGGFSFDVHNSCWKMMRTDSNSPVEIKYEYSEELQIPEEPQAMAIFNHTTENVIEIAQVFTNTLQEKPELLDIAYDEWKQKFVEWANEFEVEWGDNVNGDYIGDISKFAAEKIDEYYKQLCK